MRKIIFSLILSIFIFQPALAQTWLNCPFGQINDPFPGLCARYTDTDSDNICDNSQFPPEERNTQTPLQSKTTMRYYIIQITIILLLLYGFGKYLVYLNQQLRNKFLQKFNQRNFRYLMNLVLLISFLITAITALIDLAQIQLGWFRQSSINWPWWHIESGLVMIIISIIHIIERWRYFIKK